MANTNFQNLKIGALRRSNHYNADDSMLLQIAGGIINDCLSEIQAETSDSYFWRDLDNTVSTTASQAYVDLADTNILEITAVYQRETDTKLKRVDRRQFVQLAPDTTQHTGTPDLFYDVEQTVNGSGQNIFSLYLIPTPGSVITLRYDYIKNARFSADGTGADAEYSPLQTTFDTLIYAMFRPRFFEIIDPENLGRIRAAQSLEADARNKFINLIRSQSDHTYQFGSYRERHVERHFNVADTPTP